jgi:hypothetical protein
MARTKVRLTRSAREGKKYTAVVQQPDGTRRTVHFGAAGMSDFTKHKDPARKRNYIARHKAREDWTKAGVTTAGFWSRWLLWNKPTIAASKADISKRFGVDFVRTV